MSRNEAAIKVGLLILLALLMAAFAAMYLIKDS